MPKVEEGPSGIAGIILAAGMSTRMGRPKQLLEIDGRALVARVAQRCRQSSLDRVIVVVGHEADAVRAALAGLDVEIVENPRYRAGQASSLIAGLSQVRLAVDAVVVVLADQPGIDPATIDRLIAARRGRAKVGMARYGSERGHPVLFGRELFDELATIVGDQGGRGVIRRHQAELVLVPGGSEQVPADVDTEEAYRRLLERGAT